MNDRGQGSGVRGQGQVSRGTIPARRRLRFLALALLAPLLSALAGCQVAIPLAILIRGFDTIPAQFNKLRGDRTVVVCQADMGIKFSFADVDHRLAELLGRRLREKGVKVVNSDEVAQWLDEHGEWETAKEIGEAFEAEYVLLVTLHNFTIYENNSPNMYRGRALATVEVFDMGKDGEVVWEQEHESVFPLERALAVDEFRPQTFQRQFMQRLAAEIGRYFYAHSPGDDMEAF